eukprot:488317-Rhodomonas_salina.2
MVRGGGGWVEARDARKKKDTRRKTRERDQVYLKRERQENRRNNRGKEKRQKQTREHNKGKEKKPTSKKKQK